MFATTQAPQAAMVAAFGDASCTRSMRSTRRMRCSMPAMGMAMSTAASILIIGTGVITSVSLFVWVLLLVTLLVSLVVLISLILTGLTGLVGLESLVGQIGELATNTAQGD